MDDGEATIDTARWSVHVPTHAESLKGVTITTRIGKILWRGDVPLESSRWLPGPKERPDVWWFSDTPRLIPPPWGATPAPPGADLPATSGWDVHNDSPDFYVFLPRGDYRRLRSDFLSATGPTELIPLYALGGFDSRWYDYTEATALAQIDAYRKRQLPLDVLVVDTGWRKNASTGYEPNTNYFPNVERFFREAHSNDVHIVFNDHPEPRTTNALDPAEIQYRYVGLSGLLNEGLDVWWFDRNWMVSLATPAPELHKEVWGMRLYHDITQKVRPESRPMIMANVDGINNGRRESPPDVAAHRFPIQWTGDIGPGMEFLRYAVENAVHSGVAAAYPYVSDDLGGHTSNPTPEAYIRWIEYGALSPIFRPHCTHNLERMPWTFGPAAERIAKRYLDMRYRLLPVFYAAARENYETGEPLLRRLDLDYPYEPEAARNDEYLIGHGILVAPVLQGALTPVPAEWLSNRQHKPGLQADYFNNDNLDGKPVLSRADKTVDFDWGSGSPDPQISSNHYSARWTGTLEVPANSGDFILATVADDGARVWLDGKLVIDAWGPHDGAITESAAAISPGKPHDLRIEYQELEYNARMQFKCRPAAKGPVNRALWIPPGEWINAWTGQTFTGPATKTVAVSLDQIPLFIRSGTILPLAPEMQFTGQIPWDPITLDVYPRSGEANLGMLYEDDTVSIAYQRGEFRKTPLMVTADSAAQTVNVRIGPGGGNFRGAEPYRGWVLRVHRPANWAQNLVPVQVKANGHTLRSVIRESVRDRSTMPFGDKIGAPDSDVWEVRLPSIPVNEVIEAEVGFGERL